MLTHGRACSVRDIDNTSAIEMSAPSPPIKSLDFRGFDSSRLLILRGGNSHVVKSYRESPGKFDSRTLSREALSRRTGRIV